MARTKHAGPAYSAGDTPKGTLGCHTDRGAPASTRNSSAVPARRSARRAPGRTGRPSCARASASAVRAGGGCGVKLVPRRCRRSSRSTVSTTRGAGHRRPRAPIGLAQERRDRAARGGPAACLPEAARRLAAPRGDRGASAQLGGQEVVRAQPVGGQRLAVRRPDQRREALAVPDHPAADRHHARPRGCRSRAAGRPEVSRSSAQSTTSSRAGDATEPVTPAGWSHSGARWRPAARGWRRRRL